MTQFLKTTDRQYSTEFLYWKQLIKDSNYFWGMSQTTQAGNFSNENLNLRFHYIKLICQNTQKK